MKNAAEKVSIRHASVADANLISVLGAVTFYEAYFEQDEPPDLANYCVETFAPLKVRAEVENQNSTFFIAYSNEKAVGYAKLRTGETIDSISENSIELQRIYVLERFWGTGTGEILLKHCLAAAREKSFQTLWLGVWEENIRAQKFYAKFGFRQIGTLIFPYGNTTGINLVLEKEL